MSKLAYEFPKQLFNNPALNLLLLETPDLLSGTIENVLCSLLRREVPMQMIEYAANSGNERFKLAILMNSRTSPEIINQLAQSENQEIFEAAEIHVNYQQGTSSDREQLTKEKIAKVLESADKYAEFEIALDKVRRYPVFFEGIFDCTGMARDTFTRKNAEALKVLSAKEVIENKPKPISLSDKEIDKLSNLHHSDFSKNLNFIRTVAANPNTPISILEKIVNLDEYDRTNFQLAENPNISPYVINKLLDKLAIRINKFTNNATIIRNYRITYCNIISNPATPLKIVEALANHQDSKVKMIVANCPATPKYIVEEILSSLEKEDLNPTEFPHEYKDILKNPLLSGTLIDKFISFWKSQKKLVKNHNYLRNGQPRWIKQICTLAKHPNINCSTLKKLLEHEERSIRSSAFLNIKVSQYIVDEWGLSFLDNLSISQLQTIAKNIHTPKILLERLVQYSNDRYYVVKEALSNPCISDEIITMWESSPFYNPRMLAGIRNDKQQFLELWKSLLSDCNRLTILLDARTPIPLLVKVSLSTSWIERYAVAQNPKTPYPIIQRLADDGNQIVRNAAQVRLKS